MEAAVVTHLSLQAIRVTIKIMPLKMGNRDKEDAGVSAPVDKRALISTLGPGRDQTGHPIRDTAKKETSRLIINSKER